MYPSNDVDHHARGKQFDACLPKFVGLIRGSYYGKLLSELAWNRMETVKKIEVPGGSSVVCLNLEEDAQVNRDTSGNSLTFEDRTTHFFPPAPRVPRMPGLAPGNWFN